MFCQESFYFSVEVEAVFLVAKSVAFVVFYHVFYFYAAVGQGLHHLVAFGFVYAWVVSTLGDEEWRLDLLAVEGGAVLAEHVVVVLGMSDLFVHHLLEWSPVGWDGVHERKQV